MLLPVSVYGFGSVGCIVIYAGLEKIMIFNKNRKKNQIFLFKSDFLIFLNFFPFSSAVVHCCCIKQFKLHCELHVAQN